MTTRAWSRVHNSLPAAPQAKPCQTSLDGMWRQQPMQSDWSACAYCTNAYVIQCSGRTGERLLRARISWIAALLVQTVQNPAKPPSIVSLARDSDAHRSARACQSPFHSSSSCLACARILQANDSQEDISPTWPLRRPGPAQAPSPASRIIRPCPQFGLHVHAGAVHSSPSW